MNPDNNHTERIEAYLEGLMERPEREAFEREMQNNHELAGEVERFRRAYQMMKLGRSLDLRGELERYSNQRSHQIRKVYLYRTFSGIAASVLILCITAYVYVRNEYSNQAVVEDYFEPYAAAGVTLKGGPMLQDISRLTQGLSEYEREEFNAAISILASIPYSDPAFREARLYMGNAYMALNEPQQAVNALEVIDNENDPAVDWYLSLAFLAKNETDLARKKLEELNSSTGDVYYQKKAGEVLRKLNSVFRSIPGI